MASKIQRKKSDLNLSPIAPPSQQQDAPQESATAPEPTATAPATTPSQKPADTKAKARTYRSTDDIERRFRAAYSAVEGINGPYSSYNDFRLTAMIALTEQLEAELNNGQPFPDAPERFAAGRPFKNI